MDRGVPVSLTLVQQGKTVQNIALYLCFLWFAFSGKQAGKYALI